jgi:hypothetical protein
LWLAQEELNPPVNVPGSGVMAIAVQGPFDCGSAVVNIAT